MDEVDLTTIGDTLIDHDMVNKTRTRQLLESIESYKKAAVLLGYFSQLRDYAIEYESLTTKILIHRKELLTRYRDILVQSYNAIYKALLVPPTQTHWYARGVQKYKHVKRYSIDYYRRKLHVVLASETINNAYMRKLIDTIIMLDRYYDIYDETIAHFMDTSDRFNELMKMNFPESIQL